MGNLYLHGHLAHRLTVGTLEEGPIDEVDDVLEAEVDEGVAILDQALTDVETGKLSDEAIAHYAGW